MTVSPSAETKTDSNFVCECDEWARSACSGEPFYREHEGKQYCVLHFPGSDKASDFGNAFRRKIGKRDFNFKGVFFPDEQFFDVDFDADAHFGYATFSGNAYFIGVSFSQVDFTATTFKGKVIFDGANFDAIAHFAYANFKAEAEFREANFVAEANFAGAMFVGAAIFKGTTFSGKANFYDATFTSKADFTMARFSDWVWRNTQDEIASLREKDVTLPHRMLSIACRHLAVNAEDNHHYEDASKLRFMAMDARRLEHWRGFDFRRLSWW